MINSDNEHSHSKRCNNCSGIRPRRSSSGTKLRVIGKDWYFIYSKVNVLTCYKWTKNERNQNRSLEPNFKNFAWLEGLSFRVGGLSTSNLLLVMSSLIH